ncbi:protein disulfide-isomerase isoform X2 [Poecilia reticulata]|uniref:protein disulfide-isomerase isoform X2 n=1 Tax=Poecilia reticulata TaxID=8081 RepID=UPI0004A4DE7A|nr:PREDICTED: protein disulfide-isomerase-like protein of the testis isoform X2 [Poecilia reticulata]
MKKLWLLLLGAMFCLCVSVAADAQLDLQGDTTIPEKEGILQLEKGNFKRALRKHKQLLVHFYTPLTSEGHRVAAAFEAAAAELQGSEVKLAVIDVTKEKELVKKLHSSASILTWLQRRAGTFADLIVDLNQLEAIDDLMVVGFFKELNHELVQVFYAAAIDLPDIRFAVTQDDEVISKYTVTQDVVLLLKKTQLIQTYRMKPETPKEELVVFISVYQMDPVTEYNGQTASQILGSPVLNHALLFVNKSSEDFREIFSAFHNAAEAFRLKILFVLVNVDEHRNGRLMEYFRVRHFDAPHIRLVNLTDQITYQMLSETLDEGSIKQFCQSYLEGKAKPKLMSEPIPERWDQRPVKELVGVTLEKVAFNPNKTVFVLFYLAYSEMSRALFPLWEELAEAVKDWEDVVIAQIDASTNDINMSMQGSYPSLCLFPALYAERVVVYTGKRNIKDLVRFMDKEMRKAKRDRVKEDEDRRKYIDTLKTEEAKKTKSKDEL